MINNLISIANKKLLQITSKILFMDEEKHYLIVDDKVAAAET